MTETLLLTHTDLDGAGCAVLFAGARPDQGRVELVDNGAIGARGLAALGSGRAILVGDHGVSEGAAARGGGYIAGGGHFTPLDHHRSSGPPQSPGWATPRPQ